MSYISRQHLAQFLLLQILQIFECMLVMVAAVVRWDGRAERWRRSLPSSTILLPPASPTFAPKCGCFSLYPSFWWNDSLHLPRLPLWMTCLWCKIILSFLFISERHMHNRCYYPSQKFWSCSLFTFCLPFLECFYFSDEIIFFRFVELRRSVFKVVNLGSAGFRCCWFPHERCKERPLKWFSQLGADIDRTGGLPSTNTVFILVCELQICNSQIFPRDGWTSYSLTVAVD